MSEDAINVEIGSGNVFADLGFEPAEAEELAARAACIRRITQIKERHGWNQSELGKRIGMPQSEVSFLLRGQVSRFSLERLLAALTALGVGVRIALLDEEADAHLVVVDAAALNG
jgi:predicted XRE-type DNA-binding protein